MHSKGLVTPPKTPEITCGIILPELDMSMSPSKIRARDDVVPYSTNHAQKIIYTTAFKLYECEQRTAIWANNCRDGNNTIFYFVNRIDLQYPDYSFLFSPVERTSSISEYSDRAVTHCETEITSADLADFEDLYYAAVAKVRELYRDLGARFKSGFLGLSTMLPSSSEARGWKAVPVKAEKMIEFLTTSWETLMNSGLVAALDAAIEAKTVSRSSTLVPGWDATKEWTPEHEETVRFSVANRGQTSIGSHVVAANGLKEVNRNSPEMLVGELSSKNKVDFCCVPKDEEILEQIREEAARSQKMRDYSFHRMDDKTFRPCNCPATCHCKGLCDTDAPEEGCFCIDNPHFIKPTYDEYIVKANTQELDELFSHDHLWHAETDDGFQPPTSPEVSYRVPFNGGFFSSSPRRTTPTSTYDGDSWPFAPTTPPDNTPLHGSCVTSPSACTCPSHSKADTCNDLRNLAPAPLRLTPKAPIVSQRYIRAGPGSSNLAEREEVEPPLLMPASHSMLKATKTELEAAAHCLSQQMTNEAHPEPKRKRASSGFKRSFKSFLRRASRE
ncbi:hypothetical protein LTR16_000110 [Cryomyces antarcticus]|uniref:Uncharacterized protein n=1 Tax=Cryomyces antarcticus TaxID=329879 RepID=A0ABR0M0E7_9PEZI|nr:hypothetical protein LTR16_000110 [Cryomyces antarcticus]